MDQADWPSGMKQAADYAPAVGQGVVCLFKPAAAPVAQTIRFKGLDATRQYRLTLADGTQPPSVKSGAALRDPGLPVTLAGAAVSERIFFEAAR